MEKEIDLIELIKSILKNVKKYLLVIILLVVGTLAAFFLLYKNSNPTYRTEAIVYMNVSDIEPPTVSDIFELLNDLVGQRQFAKIAEELNIKEEAASTLFSIETELIEGNKASVRLIMVVTSSQYVDQLEQGLIKYLNDNEAIALLRDQKLERYDETSRMLDGQQRKLDSIWYSKSWSSQTDLSQLVASTIEIQDTKSSYKYTMKRINEGYMYLVRFNKGSLPKESPSFKKYLIGAILVSIILVFSFLLFLEMSKALKSS